MPINMPNVVTAAIVTAILIASQEAFVNCNIKGNKYACVTMTASNTKNTVRSAVFVLIRYVGSYPLRWTIEMKTKQLLARK